MKIRKKLVSVLCDTVLLGSVMAVTFIRSAGIGGTDKEGGWFVSYDAGERFRDKPE